MTAIKGIKSRFPIFSAFPELVYLDSAATTQKPKSVIDGITNFYTRENANIHRGIYDLAAQTTKKYEAVRSKVQSLIQADSQNEIVYNSGTTNGINLIAQSFLMPKLHKGDEVIISSMEHHANLIPWQQICIATGAVLKIIPINEVGELDMIAFQKMISPQTKMVAVVHISNSLGTINPIEEIITITRKSKFYIPILIDVAQSIAHYSINVQELDVDFLVFSGHKMFGPTGIGILYGKAQHLKEMSPTVFGGDMIRKVTFESTSFTNAPQKFEAGTTNIAGVIGLGHAIDFISSLDKDQVQKHLSDLKNLATEKLQSINSLKIIGQAIKKSAILSFVLDKVHPHDIATFLSAENIAIRAGQHCTQPLMDYLGISGTARASFSIYNTEKDIDRLVEGLKTVQSFFS